MQTVMKENKSILFHERQQFRRGWMRLLIVSVIILQMGILFHLVSTQEISKMKFAFTTIVVLAIEIPFFLLIYYMTLETIVTDEGVGRRWLPFQRKYSMLLSNDILKANTRNGPILSYGIHWVPSYGWVHNVGGRDGMQFQMRSGKRIFIGSQKINELKSVLETLLKRTIADYRNEF